MLTASQNPITMSHEKDCNMKKKDILNLIRYHVEKNEDAFNKTAYAIAEDFSANGDGELAEYIMAQLAPRTSWTAQWQKADYCGEFFHKVSPGDSPLPLPDAIMHDLQGVINAIANNTGVNRFLFSGRPGSGKTECARHISRILGRQLLMVDFESIIDSHLGQTAKNIGKLFDAMARHPDPDKVLFLFDEIDAVAMDRINERDMREMGRATSAFLRHMDDLDSRTILIATTNLASSFDRAFIRRFDYVVDFDRYCQEDLEEVAEKILADQLSHFSIKERNISLFRKIIHLMKPLPYPGEIKNLIRTSIAFSPRQEKLGYLRTLFQKIYPDYKNLSLRDYRDMGFTIRDIEILSTVPRSTVARTLKEDNGEEL